MVFTFPKNANMYEESCFFFGWMNYHRKSSKLFYNNLFSTTSYQCQRAFQLRWHSIRRTDLQQRQTFITKIWGLEKICVLTPITHWIRWKRFGNPKKVPSLWAVFSTNSMLFGPSHISLLIFSPFFYIWLLQMVFTRGCVLGFLLVKMSFN